MVSRMMLRCASATLALAMAGCATVPPPPPPPPPAEMVAVPSETAPDVSAQWKRFMNDFVEASFRADPSFGVSQGRHEYDGQIADFSDAAIRAEIDRLKAQRRLT